MVVEWLAEWSLPTTGDSSLNLDVSNFIEHIVAFSFTDKTKKKIDRD